MDRAARRSERAMLAGRRGYGPGPVT